MQFMTRMLSEANIFDRNGLQRAESSLILQRRLSAWNRERLSPALPSVDWLDGLVDDAGLLALEGQFVEQERRFVSERVATAPRDADAFVAWFEALKDNGPGQDDALFPWLAERRRPSRCAGSCTQEVAGEAGFDDLVALTQVKLPTRRQARARAQLLGRDGARARGRHAWPDARATRARVEPRTATATTWSWESLALGNLMIALAMNRRYAYHSIGALGVIELTAPGRAVCVNRGSEAPRLRRRGPPLLRAARDPRRQAFGRVEPRGPEAAGRREPQRRGGHRRGRAAASDRRAPVASNAIGGSFASMSSSGPAPDHESSRPRSGRARSRASHQWL